MKKILCSVCATVFLSATSYGAPVFSDNFNSYSNGDLIGQGPWVITGTNPNNPIQVSSGRISMSQLQDLNAPLTSNINPVDGTSFYIGMTLNISTATPAGDFFVHTSTFSGDASVLTSRLYARSFGAGFQLGYLETVSGTINYGIPVLNFNTDYRVAVAYDFVAGPVNDTGAVYVDPTSSIRGNNTPYLTDTWTSPIAEPTVIGAVNLRQGGGSAPTNTLDNLVVSTDFADVAAVPEPSTWALFTIGALALLGLRHRKN